MCKNMVLSPTIKNIADQMMQARVPLRDQVVWLSNVAGEEIASLTSQLLQEQSCVNYRFATTQTQQCGVRNGYRKPQQLGVDRWLAMLAAFHLPQRATGQSLCVVDCGTALTLDVLDATGRHLGGYIAPGLTAMREMLNQKLAHIDIKPTDPGAVKVLADNTADGVARGCAQVLLGGFSRCWKIVCRLTRNRALC